MTNQTEIKNYLKQVKKHCPRAFRKKLMKELEGSLYDFFEQRPDGTTADIIQHFGSPESFADEYILAMDETTRQGVLHKSKWVKRIVFIAVLIIVLVVGAAAACIIRENSQHVGRYYMEETTNGGMIE